METTIVNSNKQEKGSALPGFVLLVLLGVAAWWISRQVNDMSLPFNIPGRVLEYPLWAALIGLAGNLALKVTGLHGLMQLGFKTELFLKIGLVLLGASVNMALLVTAASGAILQGIIMIMSVFFFGWWLGGLFELDEKLKAVMATALAVCGVSAAIAAAGSVMAKKEQVTYVTGLVILVALPLMVIAPLLAGLMGLSETVAGAWFGGNIDTSAAVVGAGTIYGEQAQKIASIVKSTQNAMIGVVAFALAVYFAAQQKPAEGEAKAPYPTPRLVWDRFPKFVLGFIAASVLYTMGLIDGGKGTPISALKDWAFLLAFVSMGLEFSVQEFKSMGWRPVVVFLMVTVFNTMVALGVSWLIFEVVFPIT